MINSYPSILEKDQKVIDTLVGQLIHIFGTMDEDTAKQCLDEFPRMTNTLTAFKLNEWLKGRQKRPMAVPYYRDDDDWKPPTEAEKERCRRQVLAFKAGKDVRNA